MPEIETLGDAYAAKWGIRMRCGEYRSILLGAGQSI
jgi:hypothetical protein